AASLMKITEIKPAVRDGDVKIGEILMSVHANENAIFGVDGVPFLAAGQENARKLWAAQKPIVENILEGENIDVLYTVPWPGQGIYVQEEIATLDDMKGVRFRSYNAATARLAELMGAVPTQVQYAEVAQAFSTGVVGAMVTSAQSGVDLKAWDFLKVYYNTEAMHPKNMVIVNKAAFDALEPDVRNALLEAAKIAEDRGWKRSEEIGVEAVEELKKNGILVPEPPKEVVDRMREIGDQMISEWLASAGENGAKLKSSYDGK
ncbi:MAG: TRAP transporter substrate-binding protein, partial [Sneathiella sp.]